MHLWTLWKFFILVYEIQTSDSTFHFKSKSRRHFCVSSREWFFNISLQITITGKHMWYKLRGSKSLSLLKYWKKLDLEQFPHLTCWGAGGKSWWHRMCRRSWVQSQAQSKTKRAREWPSWAIHTHIFKPWTETAQGAAKSAAWPLSQSSNTSDFVVSELPQEFRGSVARPAETKAAIVQIWETFRRGKRNTPNKR